MNARVGDSGGVQEGLMKLENSSLLSFNMVNCLF